MPADEGRAQNAASKRAELQLGLCARGDSRDVQLVTDVVVEVPRGRSGVGNDASGDDDHHR